MLDTQTILFGGDPNEGIVAVEPVGDRVVLYRRVDGQVLREEREFSPWLITPRKMDLLSAEWRELAGDGYYKFLATFPSWGAARAARFKLRDEHVSAIAYPSAAKQYLTLSGQTMFKGMSFADAHRMQLDIETLGLSPEPPENAIFLIAMSDNRGYEEVLEGTESSGTSTPTSSKGTIFSASTSPT
jgi:hypothetical protein